MLKKFMNILKESFITSFSATLNNSNLTKYEKDKVDKLHVYQILSTMIALNLILLISQLFYLIMDISGGHFAANQIISGKYIFTLIAEAGLVICCLSYIIIASINISKPKQNITSQKVLEVTNYLLITIFLGFFIISKVLRKGGISNIDSNVIYLQLILIVCPIFSRALNYFLEAIISAFLIILCIVVKTNPGIIVETAVAEANGFPSIEWLIYNLAFVVIGVIVLTFTFGRNIRHLIQNLKLTDANTELKLKIETDELTQIYNRRAMKMYIENKENEWKETSPNVAFIMIDIDFFKNYNDRYGHLKGDDCLKRVAQCVKLVVDQYNGNVYRYGGEEFLAIIEKTTEEQAIISCKEIHKQISKLKILHEGTKRDGYDEEFLTVSLGLNVENKFNRASNQWILDADKQLYKAKHEGRNCTAFNDILIKNKK